MMLCVRELTCDRRSPTGAVHISVSVFVVRLCVVRCVRVKTHYHALSPCIYDQPCPPLCIGPQRARRASTRLPRRFALAVHLAILVEGAGRDRPDDAAINKAEVGSALRRAPAKKVDKRVAHVIHQHEHDRLDRNRRHRRLLDSEEREHRDRLGEIGRDEIRPRPCRAGKQRLCERGFG